MHVAMVNLTGGGMSGGYRKYLLSLVPRLRRDEKLRLDVYVPPSLVEPLASEGLDGLLSWAGGDDRQGFPRLREELRRRAPDVVFVPTARFLDCGRPCVVMVRNMEPLERPLAGNTVRAGLRNLARGWIARRACRRATRVIAVSRHVADFLTSRWGLEARKVGVVHHGVDPAPAATARPPALIGLEPGHFLFTAGSLRPARGVEDAIRALRHLGPDAPPLVVAGQPDPDSLPYARHLRRLANRAGIAGRIIWAGGLDRASMDWSYANCAVFVMTSRSEACPNTVLEAMSYGCLSVSVQRAPMPEMFVDTAAYYGEGDAPRLARQIADLLGLGGRERTELSDSARRQAAEFTWERTADHTRAELEKAAR